MPDWPPLKGASLQIITPLYDGSGSLVTGGGSLSACVSKDAGAFAAATCTVTELNSGAGLYAFKLSATEMDADVIAYKLTSDSASARPSIGVLYTAASRQLKDLAYPATAGQSLAVDGSGQVNVAAIAASAVGASQLAAGAVHAAAVAASTLTSTKFGSGALVADTLGASILTASKFAANAIDAAAIAPSALTSSEVTDSVTAQAWIAGTRTLTSLGASTITASTFGVGAIDSVAVAASALTGSKFGACFFELGYLTDGAASRIGTVVRTGCALTEQGVGAPPATPTLEQSLMYPYMAWRNSASTTTGCILVTNDAGTVITKAPISDSASTFEKGEFVSG